MLSIIISTRNRAQSLHRTLESLGRMVPPEAHWEIVVVDNASTDGTRDTVAEFAATAPAPVRYVFESRPGKSFAVNAGIVAASGDLLAFTDDDVIVDPGWGRAFSAAMQGSSFIGAGGRIAAEWTAAPPRWLAADQPDRLMTVVAFDAGAEPGELLAAPFGPNMAFRRTAFDRYGVFRTDLGPGPGPYLPGQDTEFGRRLLRAGERLAWVPDAVVHHLHQPNKMTKRHVTAWYFGYGRMAVRTGMTSTNVVKCFGVPRYLIRRFLSNLGRWATCVEPKRRFRYWAETGRVAGAIAETLLNRRTVVSEAPWLSEIGVLAVVRDDFDDPWQSRHQILTRLSQYFHVVWVEPAPKWRDARCGRWRARVWAPDHDGAYSFVVYTPGWLPFLKHSAHLARLVERMRLANARRLLGGRGCKKIVLSLWRPAFGHALTAVPHDLAAYHIDDEYTFARVEGPPDPRELGVIEAVDVVSVHSPGLMQRKGHINPRTMFIPNGVDYATYAAAAVEPPDLAAIPHPRIGYTGYLKSQLDWPLIHELVVLHPEWNFVFVGPQRSRSHVEMLKHVEALARLPNAHFLGEKGQNELAAYPQHFDVCIMPYRIDDYTKCIYPLKLHEYLATGRPVVGARILSLEGFADVVTLASTTTEWSAAIADALEPAAQAEPRRLARQEVARRHDWDTIACRMAQVILAGFGLPISWGHSDEAHQE